MQCKMRVQSATAAKATTTTIKTSVLLDEWVMGSCFINRPQIASINESNRTTHYNTMLLLLGFQLKTETSLLLLIFYVDVLWIFWMRGFHQSMSTLCLFKKKKLKRGSLYFGSGKIFTIKYKNIVNNFTYLVVLLTVIRDGEYPFSTVVSVPSISQCNQPPF